MARSSMYIIAAETISELREGLTSVIQMLTALSDCNITSVSSACELFLRFITLNVSK